MRKILVIAFIFSFGIAWAQDKTVQELKTESAREIKKDPKDTVDKIWKFGGIYNLNVSQGTLSNWAAGGDDFSLALNSLLSAYAYYHKGRHSWNSTLDFNLGYINTTSLGARKNDDRIDLLSKYDYGLTKKWNLAALFDFRSQFFKGYNYNDNNRSLSSDFLSPAYIILSLGLDYKPNNHFSAFISPVTARWIIVKNDSLSAKGEYGVDPGRHVKGEFGAYATINYWTDFSKSLNYKGRLDLFSNYLNNPQNVSVYMTNLFSVKISKVLAATWDVDLIYDDEAKLFGPNKNSPALQFKSVVGIGLQVKF